MRGEGSKGKGRHNICKGTNIVNVEETTVEGVRDVPLGHEDISFHWICLPYALEEAGKARPELYCVRGSQLIRGFVE